MSKYSIFGLVEYRNSPMSGTSRLHFKRQGLIRRVPTMSIAYNGHWLSSLWHFDDQENSICFSFCCLMNLHLPQPWFIVQKASSGMNVDGCEEFEDEELGRLKLTGDLLFVRLSSVKSLSESKPARMEISSSTWEIWMAWPPMRFGMKTVWADIVSCLSWCLVWFSCSSEE